jgi:hypothetical protein
LKYNKHPLETIDKQTIPLPLHYSYNVPYFSLSHGIRDRMASSVPAEIINKFRLKNNPLPSSSSDSPTMPIIKNIPIPNWTPLPENHNLPDHLLPFVPTTPLSSISGKTYHPPGSNHWLKHIYKQRKDHYKKLV